jgi:quinol monooxygenase YgiN
MFTCIKKGDLMIYSIVTMIIKEGQMAEFLAECKKIRPIVQAENGCCMYDYTREFDTKSARQEKVDKNRITLYEKWESIEALNIHSEMPHMNDFATRIAGMRESVIIRTGTEAF